ncbi:hypothetical protein [Brevibacillus daliensis]|uniref:hypothetical protein n=1 Tax=Brevibacillus daliensis TaxID=2892995 RepID=UPI001E62DC05|nr:hypothetical protein [Brevibacillus daliensis]
MTATQKRIAMAGAIVLIGIAAFFFFYMKEGQLPFTAQGPMAPLFLNDLNATQIAEVEEFLQKKDVKYELQEHQVLVPETEVLDTQVELGKAGIPSSSR